MKNLNSIFLFLFLCLCGISNSQESIKFKNPSFEDIPRQGGTYSYPIKGWKDCGLLYFAGESPPDIHPLPHYGWDVRNEAYAGQTYLGLVTRYNNSWESVAQQLAEPLHQDSCYRVSVWLCRSDSYISNTQRSRDKPENFINPIALYVWGGKQECVMSTVLASSDPIDHSDWKEYVFEFTPRHDVTAITLQAYYFLPNNGEQVLKPEPYNGHVLVDHLSPITQITCE